MDGTLWLNNSGPLISFVYVPAFSIIHRFLLWDWLTFTEFAFHGSLVCGEVREAEDMFSFLSPEAKLWLDTYWTLLLRPVQYSGHWRRENCVPSGRIASKLTVRWQFSIVVPDMIHHKGENYWLWCWKEKNTSTGKDRGKRETYNVVCYL